MKWAKTAAGKLRHLRNYCADQRAERRYLLGDYHRGFKDAMTQVGHHVDTLLAQLERGE